MTDLARHYTASTYIRQAELLMTDLVGRYAASTYIRQAELLMTDLVGHYAGVGGPVPCGLYPSIQKITSYIYQ